MVRGHRRQGRPFLGLSLLGLCAALVGASCGDGGSTSGDASSTSTGAGGATVDCTHDARAMTFASDLSAMGQQKIFQVRLANAIPAPPARGNNAWRVEILDAKGAPVQGASVKVTPYMPDHKHGTQAVPTATQEADGSFSVTPLYLFMPGLWTVTFDVSDGTSTDSAVFAFCIEG